MSAAKSPLEEALALAAGQADTLRRMQLRQRDREAVRRLRAAKTSRGQQGDRISARLRDALQEVETLRLQLEEQRQVAAIAEQKVEELQEQLRLRGELEVKKDEVLRSLRRKLAEQEAAHAREVAGMKMTHAQELFLARKMAGLEAARKRDS
eukprot:PLAT1695.1.p1 GENE.PLAT1695.1~~PLAT1695.1.p1  ORF type:complete len:152 (-),score=41.93 PLAT1695.1:139-594(-)